jgi:hypothetical protein
MNKKVLIPVTIKVSEEQLGLLNKTLELSRERQKNAVRFIQKRAIPDCISDAVSTVDVRHWKELKFAAHRLGVESPI